MTEIIKSNNTNNKKNSCLYCHKRLKKRTNCSKKCQNAYLVITRTRKYILYEIPYLLKTLSKFTPSLVKKYSSNKLVCYMCSVSKNIKSFYFNQRNTGRCQRYSECMECSLQNRTFRDNEDRNYINRLLSSCKFKARQRERIGRVNCGTFNLIEDDITAMKIKQNNKCILSGKELTWQKKADYYTASIDRLDCDKGYIINNIQLVGFCVNQARNNLSIPDFVKMCNYVTIFSKNNNSQNNIVEKINNSDEKKYIKQMLKTCKATAKTRLIRGRTECGISLLTYEDIIEFQIKQNNKCALSGQELIWQTNGGYYKASIDRLDCDKGYVKDNIQLVGFCVNQGRSNLSIPDFIDMCSSVNTHSAKYLNT
jgi:hypothetical protein